MRMWNVNPKVMCRKHLMGEHVELHMFVGTINKGVSIEGYVKNNLVEPRHIFLRHQILVKEMTERGYRHNSELPVIKLDNLPEKILNNKIRNKESFDVLMSRCPECRKNCG